MYYSLILMPVSHGRTYHYCYLLIVGQKKRIQLSLEQLGL